MGQWEGCTVTVLKFPDTKNVCCDIQIKTNRPFHRDICPHGADGKANSTDPDQTAPYNRSGLIWVYTVCQGLSVQKLRNIMVYGIYNGKISRFIQLQEREPNI